MNQTLQFSIDLKEAQRLNHDQGQDKLMKHLLTLPTAEVPGRDPQYSGVFIFPDGSAWDQHRKVVYTALKTYTSEGTLFAELEKVD